MCEFIDVSCVYVCITYLATLALEFFDSGVCLEGELGELRPLDLSQSVHLPLQPLEVGDHHLPLLAMKRLN